ncbi:hypothetical protein BDW62DRAFT_205677 [Aspergillus aurantiobrunneus]
MSQAKRVILRYPEAMMDDSDLYKPVRVYFTKLERPLDELESGRHWIHVQPPTALIDAPQLPNPKVHIVIDLEKDQFSGPLGPGLPHELYGVRMQGDEFVLGIYEEDVKHNMLQKIRYFTDNWYPWGHDKPRADK